MYVRLQCTWGPALAGSTRALTISLPLAHPSEYFAEQAQLLAVLRPVAAALRFDRAVVVPAGFGCERRERIGGAGRGRLRDGGPGVGAAGGRGSPRQRDVGLLPGGARAEQT